MTTIRKTLSFDDFFFDTYLREFENDNLSKHIQKLVSLGYEAMENGLAESKKKLISSLNKITNLELENRQIKSQLSKAKKGEFYSVEDIIKKYSLNADHISSIKEISSLVKKKPEFLDGNFSRFVNESGINISKIHFKTLIHGGV